jgi:hypothetical protein
MIKLITLLTECFYTSQWLDVLQKYPQIVDLLKNDPITKKRGYFIMSKVDWKDTNDIAYNISNYGGHCGLGPLDFNYNKVKDFLSKDIYNEYNKTDNNITKETLNKILPLVKKYFEKSGDNKSKETELNWVKTEYNRLLNRFGKERADDWLDLNLKLGNSAWRKLKLKNKDIKDFLK